MSEELEAAGGRTEPDKGFGGWINGRARRREYWIFAVPLGIATLLLAATEIPGVTLLAGLPMLMVWIRRLHDMGFTGWIAPVINVVLNATGFLAGIALPPEAAGLLALLLYAGSITVLGVIPGQRVSNRYGPPKGKAAALAETFS